MDRREAARAYYRALDEHDYGRLEDLLAAGFVHDRPDRTIEGRDRFVRFMREGRPHSETDHALDAVYESGDREVAVRGRLFDDEEVIVRFVDVFGFEEGRIAELTTYTN